MRRYCIVYFYDPKTKQLDPIEKVSYTLVNAAKWAEAETQNHKSKYYGLVVLCVRAVGVTDENVSLPPLFS